MEMPISSSGKTEKLSTGQQLAEDKTGDKAVEIFELAVLEYGSEGQESASDVFELLDWTFNDHLPHEEAVRQALAAESLAACKDILVRARRAPKGRPSTIRIPAVKALIYKNYLGWKWRELVAAFCPCGNAKHTLSCQESLRETVKRLKRELRKYDLQFLPE